MRLLETVQSFFLGNKEDPKEFDQKNGATSFEKPQSIDGEVVIAGGLIRSATVEVANNSKNEKELIATYRSIAKIPEVNEAIDEIVNEMLSQDDVGKIIRLNLSDVEKPEATKKAITEKFEEVLELMSFQDRGHEYVKRWYIDGRIAFHKLVDKKRMKEGVRGVRYINPLSIEKVIEYEKIKENGIDVFKTTKEYFKYNPSNKTNMISMKGDEANNGSSMSFGSNGFWAGSDTQIFGSNQILAISPEAVVYSTSGFYDEEFGTILSYLHPAIKPANNLSIMEDSLVIYRMTRAPEKRIFYVDVGNLPKNKGEQYMNEMMTKFRSNMSYDSITGNIKDPKRFQSMLEDFWIPRRENGRATEISTLEGGQGLGDMDEVEYFLKKLYSSLKIPSSRFSKDQPMIAGIGRSSEITRDEIRFQKFIDRLRNKFNKIFEDILETHLILTGVLTRQEWNEIKGNIRYEWAKDSFYVEMKETEMLRERLSTLQMATDYVGKYFSEDYILERVLHIPDDEIEQHKKDVEETAAKMDKEEKNED